MSSRNRRRDGGHRGGDRGQATVLGAVLVLGMVITGTALVVTLGATALTDTQSTSELERAENSMTLFNTRTSMVALGNSPSQSVSFGNGGGKIESLPDNGWMRVTHNDFNGSDDEVMFNKTLGAVVYRNDDTEIAYQGGGVWRKSDSGDGLMVSPPEFHYRGATLTLPIVRVASKDSGSGGVTATISRDSETRRVFPNETGPTTGTPEIGAPYNGTDDPYENPVANGTVNVTVQSRYYQGWADYFRQRTEGNVTEFPSDNRVRVTLVSLAGSVGDFEMPEDGNSVPVRGVGDEHPVDKFTVSLGAENKSGGGGSGRSFQNAEWSLYADNGNERFEIHIGSQGKCNGGSYNDEIDVSVYYYNSSGSENIEEEWVNGSIDPEEPNNGFSVNCTTKMLNANLTAVSAKVEYEDIEDDVSGLSSTGNKWEYGSDIKDHEVDSDTVSFDMHGVDGGNYSKGAEEELGFVVDHYLQLLGPNFDLTVQTGPGNSRPIDEDRSSGTLDYEPASGAQYITFLHVTENEVNVTFD